MIHTMLPAQYASRVRSADPHKRLMAAVLRAVVDDCRGGSDYRRATGKGVVGPLSIRRALAYVASTDRAWPFSFENLCDGLGLDSATLRKELIGVWPDEADEAGGGEEEEGEGHAQNERAVRVRTRGGEAGCRPEGHQDGRPVSAQGVG